MLNELIIIERGTRGVIKAVERHPDVKDCRRMPTLLLGLDPTGLVEYVRPVPDQVRPWTLRDGQHNSFPFVQLKSPLLTFTATPDTEAARAAANDRKNIERRKALLSLAQNARFQAEAFKDWPGAGLLNRLHARRQQLAGLGGPETNVVLATVDRFILTCARDCGAGSQKMLESVTRLILHNLERSSESDWVEIAVALLVGHPSRGDEWEAGGALLFEASGQSLSIVDPRLVIRVSEALRTDSPATEDARDPRSGVCALTGSSAPLLKGNFPQPNLPVLGQTYIFSKNKDIPANDRYGRFSCEAMPVGEDVAIRLAAALQALTSEDRKNIAWRAVPGEVPKQRDLLVAFVAAAPEAPLAESLAGDDLSDSDTVDSIAAFEKRTERLIRLVKAKVGSDVTRTPVELAILRKVDPANRKVVYHGRPTVGHLYAAANTWIVGERNVPAWLTLPVPKKGERKSTPKKPPHVSPLALVGFSRVLYIRGGTERQEAVGVPAPEMLRLFLDKTAQAPARRLLRIVLSRRLPLLCGTAHVQHTPTCWERRPDVLKRYDRFEALRTVTVLALLLHKLDREKEIYMNETAFKLGQLLAAADMVHAGYCADVRDGAVPPSLLGNQVFAMAQTAPAKALAVLCRRWKPYDGWAKKASRDPGRYRRLINSTATNEQRRKHEQQCGWDIWRAVRHAREIGPLAAQLGSLLSECRPDDTFRAELLLGYLAGLPKSEKPDQEVNAQDESQVQED